MRGRIKAPFYKKEMKKAGFYGHLDKTRWITPVFESVVKMRPPSTREVFFLACGVGLWPSGRARACSRLLRPHKAWGAGGGAMLAYRPASASPPAAAATVWGTLSGYVLPDAERRLLRIPPAGESLSISFPFPRMIQRAP